MTALLHRARQSGYGLGYFEAWDSYSLEAVLEAAEEEGAPVILGFGCMMPSSSWLDSGGIELLGGIGRAVAARARVPVALLLNEAQTYEQAVRGMEAGFNAVMLDTSAWRGPKALEAVARLTREAHARDVAVEAELGRLPDAGEAGIDDSAATLTDPEAAAQFVAKSGVDCLAVSIGNVHLLADGVAPVDLERLEAIHRRVSVPLVIHGGSSFPPDAVPRAIANGVAKINVGTVLKRTFLDAVQKALVPGPHRANVHELLGSHLEADFMVAGQRAMKAKVRKLIRLYGGTGRATE
jgi:fructose-bisphosphate aldolase class II